MQDRLYYIPLIHCPSLCPYRPPRSLFGDDYDPLREDAVWKFCGNHCWLTRDSERPCLIELERRQGRAARPHAA